MLTALLHPLREELVSNYIWRILYASFFEEALYAYRPVTANVHPSERVVDTKKIVFIFPQMVFCFGIVKKSFAVTAGSFVPTLRVLYTTS